jgi:thymidine phosphorylase
MRFVRAQGGDTAFLEGGRGLPSAPIVREVPAQSSGYVTAIDALEIGLASVGVGAGRTVAGEAVDHAVGVVISAPVGSRVEAGDPVALVHAADETRAAVALRRVGEAFSFGDRAPEPKGRVLEVLESA